MSNHGLRTPNEGTNQIYLKTWADVADKICFGRTLKILEWELTFGRGVKAISSPGVRNLFLAIDDEPIMPMFHRAVGADL